MTLIQNDRRPRDNSEPAGVTRGDIRTLAEIVRQQRVTATHVQPVVRAQTATVALTVSGGPTVAPTTLIEWAAGEDFELTSITYDATYTSVIASATVKWPDGSAGTFTATTINATFEAIDAYTITHTDSGKTVTQTAVTRNADGNVTAKPALTISP